MYKFLTVKDGHEDGVDLMVPISPGMEVELDKTLEHLTKTKQPIEITFGQMTNEEFRENQIQSVMYGECCDREEAIKIVDNTK